MKRRQFIHAVMATLALTAPTGSQARQFSPVLSALSHTGLSGFLGDHDCICSIGHAYRNQFPAENDPATLVLAIISGPEKTTLPDKNNLEKFIDLKIDQDFDQGSTVNLDGWILSRTEARQSALYSMLHS